MVYNLEIVDTNENKARQEQRIAAFTKVLIPTIRTTKFIDKETLTEDDMLNDGKEE